MIYTYFNALLSDCQVLLSVKYLFIYKMSIVVTYIQRNFSYTI